MTEIKRVKYLQYTLLFPFILLVGWGSCANSAEDPTPPGEQSDCIRQAGAVAKKIQLETELRGQVQFLGEPENFGSITEKMAEDKLPALSLAVIHNGKIAWADRYHNVNFPEEQHLDCASLFQAASLSKPVTFLAALRMQAAGDIDLDENIENYLEDFQLPPGKQTAANPVTLRNIFSHTSGISAGGYQGYARDLALPSDLAIVRGEEGVNTPAIEVVSAPGELLAYSGGAYTLAELALQDRYGESFANIMEQWILAPAGMHNSTFTQPLPDSTAHRVAKGYTPSGAVVAGGWRNYPEQAAAGLWSNAVDMAQFLIEIYQAYQGESSIFSPSDIQSILSQERDGHVYGFVVNRAGDDIAITHYGGNAGYRTGMTISLTSGNGLVYLINSDNGGALGNELLLSAAQVYGWKHFEQTKVQRKPVSADILQGLTGTYRWNDQVDLSITFDEANQQLSLHFPNGDAYPLTAIAGDAIDFIHANTGVEVSFSMQDDVPAFTLYGETAVPLEAGMEGTGGG
jgi:CubicO group peptidase (beta-lactamase class C family)